MQTELEVRQAARDAVEEAINQCEKDKIRLSTQSIVFAYLATRIALRKAFNIIADQRDTHEL
jgi:hypothetical protein